jgi:NADP-dependent 3-hydroxy acid dehydrogenase YdfG
MTNKPLSQQLAIVTGGGTGIGRAFSEALAAAGAKVVIASRREAVLQATADEINQTHSVERVFPYAFDIREREQINSLVNKVIERWQTIDLLINNSGLAVAETVEVITEEGWDKVMDTNLRGVMQLVRSVLPHMTRNDFGDIVNVSSQAGKHGYADVPSYCASKFGLLGTRKRCAIMCARPARIFESSTSVPDSSMSKTRSPNKNRGQVSFMWRTWRRP